MNKQKPKVKRGPQPGPEGNLVHYRIMVPESLKDWLLLKGPKFVRNELNRAREVRG